MSDGTETTHDSLSRIATILGVSVDQFFGEEAPEPAALGRCLELLYRIRSEDGMRQALDSLDRIAREEQAPGASGL